MRSEEPGGARGVGSYTVFSALTIHMPQDADDPAGVELEDGSVVVRDVNAGTWVLR